MSRRRRRRTPKPTAAPPTLDPLLAAIPADELLLRGLTARDAEVRLRNFILTAARAHAGKVVRVITGKGRGSPGQPVLPGVVERLLDGELQLFVVRFRGTLRADGYLVQVAGTPQPPDGPAP